MYTAAKTLRALCIRQDLLCNAYRHLLGAQLQHPQPVQPMLGFKAEDAHIPYLLQEPAALAHMTAPTALTARDSSRADAGAALSLFHFSVRQAAGSVCASVACFWG